MNESHVDKLSSKGKVYFSEGMLLGLIPVAVYALGYSYESGFVSYYGVPTSLISIDAPAMVSSVLFGAIYVYALMFWVSLSVDSSSSDSYTEKTIGIIMIYFGFFPIVFMLFVGGEYLAFAMALPFVMMLLIVLLRILEKKWGGLRNYSKKLHIYLSNVLGNEKEEVKSASNSLQNIGGVLIIALIPFLLAYAAGRNNAKTQKTYSVITSTAGELSVVRIYGENIIAVPFNRKEHSFTQEFAIMKMGNIDNVVFKNEKVGPLKDISGLSPSMNLTNASKMTPGGAP